MAGKQKLINNTEDIKAEQEELLSKANAPLREKVDWVIAWYKQDSRHSLMNRWELGVQIKEVLDDKDNNYERFGTKSFKTIAAFSGEAEHSLRICATFAGMYTRNQVIDLTEMVMADEVTPLSFSHIRGVLTIKEEAVRQKTINLALLNCWSADQISKYVISLKGKPSTNNAAGRPIAVPKSLDGVMSQQLEFATAFEKRNVHVWKTKEHSVKGQLAKLPSEQYTEDLASQLGHLALRLKQLADEAVVRAKEVEDQFKLVRDTLDDKYKLGTKLASQTKTEDHDEPSSQRPRRVKKEEVLV